jgi:hypothetical protein
MSQLCKPRILTEYPDNCQQCETAPRQYVSKDKVWCRECLDKEEYPDFAHLTQEEREALRRENSKGRRDHVVNSKNMGF